MKTRYVEKHKHHFENHPKAQPPFVEKKVKRIEKQQKPERSKDKFINKMKII